ncbi:MAG: hypothetical protein ACI9KE_001528 [Polyangiales bacterium]|jgi:hypothetical protein
MRYAEGMNKNAAILALCLLSAALGFGAGGASASVDGDVSLTPAPTTQAAEVDATEALPLDGSCGDYSCDAPEDCQSCPQDCGSCCGNGQCEPPEDSNSCPQDC